MLFVSPEGTLGVVTKAELKLNPLPIAKKTIMAVYDDVAVAGESVFRVLENGVIPDKGEPLDNWVINRIEEMMPMGLPKKLMRSCFSRRMAYLRRSRRRPKKSWKSQRSMVRGMSG